jgi:hypothetical protein
MNENQSPPSAEANLFTVLLNNQLRLMAQSQTVLYQLNRLISHLTGISQIELMKEVEEIYRQEINKVNLSNVAEMRALLGMPPANASGGGLEGAG